MTRQPGTLDPEFGNGGLATVPPEKGRNPDIESLQVIALDTLGDGGLAFCGHSAGSGPEASLMFTKVLKDGTWDEDTGHVKVVINEEAPASSHQYLSLTSAIIDEQQEYLALGQPSYYDYTTYQSLSTVSVARYGSSFKAVPNFGKNGITWLEPGEPWTPIPTSDSTKCRKSPKPAGAPAISRTVMPFISRYRRPIAVIGGNIQVLYPQTLEDEFANIISEDVWIASFDLHTGIQQSCINLKDKNNTSVHMLHGVFQADGSFFLLARNAQARVVVLRYKRDGSLDLQFADGQGEIDLFGYVDLLVTGFEASNERLIITRAVWTPNRNPTNVFCYTSDGKRDVTFNGGQALELQREPESGLAMVEVHTDAQSRIVLAGAQFKASNQEMNVVRLHANGQLDQAFGTGGYFDYGRDLRTANALFLEQDAIRVLSEFPTAFSQPYLERVAKLFA
ncbi:hypothetical protein ACIPW4_10480 [Pseudomonas sp. NPDC089996]|uniref:hypothetical protein n=1 Tax=Pseudomonas sp. NPDC089996 TaxID=3364474 RepID=UPI0037F4EA9D